MTNTTATPKPPVFDSRGAEPAKGKATPIELRMRVKLTGDKDKDAAGKPLEGVVTGIEYQRGRVVVRVPDFVNARGKDTVVRPASQVTVIKSKSGKIERIEKAARAARKPRVEAPAAESVAVAETSEERVTA